MLQLLSLTVRFAILLLGDIMKIATAVSLFLLAIVSCSFQGPKGVSGDAPDAPKVTAQPATAGECGNGGTEIRINDVLASIICNGTDGLNGSNGSNGTDGTNGSNGTNGTNGTDLTPVQLIPLCPGVPTYPSVFVEYGICVGNNLYGVYSANNGFLALLPPGTYTSNAIGSSCNMIILPNCVVTH